MKTLLSTTFLLVSLALASAQNFLVSLDGAQDGGGLRMGSGSGTLTLSGNLLTLNNIIYSGLSPNTIAAHIHGPSGPFPGSANVLYSLAGLTTLGGTSGSFNGTVTLVNGTLGFSLAEQLAQLNSGMWYINIHTTPFTQGEIRGAIVPVPEPGTWALGGLGMMALLFWRRRQGK